MAVWPLLAHWAVSSTVQTGVIVAVILLVTRVAWRHMSARWGAALWIVVLIRLAVPWSPSGVFPASTGVAAPTILQWVPLLAHPVASTPMPGASVAGPAAALSPGVLIPWSLIAAMIWGLGALMLAFGVLRRERRFRQAVAGAHRIDRVAMPTAPGFDIRETSAVRAPAVFGLRRPQILIPLGLMNRLTPEQWQWVVQHESHHIGRFDIAVRWAMEIAAIVYWFNPFVWAARHEVRAAQELAADEGVIHPLSPTERLEYGRMLLAVAAEHGDGIPSVAGMTLRRSSLARRIERIRQAPHRTWVRGTTAGAVVLTVLLTLSVAVVAAGGRGQTQPPQFPPGFALPSSTSSSAPAGSGAPAIHAATFAQAVRTALTRQIRASDRTANVTRELSRLTIASIHSAHHLYAAVVLLPYHGALFLGQLVARREGARWTFQFPSNTQLAWVDPQRPLNVPEMGGQLTPSSPPYLFIAGAVTRPDIRYVVIHFTSGARVRLKVSPEHTFAYLTEVYQGTQAIDAYSAGHRLVYRW